MDFLLRQAVLVASSAIESYFWDTLRENTLTVIKAKGREAGASFCEAITLTVDDYPHRWKAMPIRTSDCAKLF